MGGNGWAGPCHGLGWEASGSLRLEMFECYHGSQDCQSAATQRRLLLAG